MGVYVVTGAASGMGQQAATKLRAQGHTVIAVDVKEGDIVADLSTAEGRQAAADQVLARSDRLDGAVLAAGIGPTPGKDSARLIFEVNYRGVVDLLQAWRPALAAADKAKVVVIGSNSTTTTPAVPRRTVRALLAGDTDKAVRSLKLFGPVAPSLGYAASKIAVSHWVRRTAVSRQWAGEGIRLNALAPGAIMTPLLEKQLATPREAKAVKAFPVPLAVSETPLSWPTGCCSCCRTPPISSAAASFSSTADPMPTSGRETGRNLCLLGGCRPICGGSEGSAPPGRPREIRTSPRRRHRRATPLR